MLLPEGLGMGHPLFMARMQSAMDGVLHAMMGANLGDAIRKTVPRIRTLFGEGIPRELIEVAVTVGYCSCPDACVGQGDEERG